ncbi:MAG: sugar phosphate isomerase/epimerase [Candidatus Aminicenantes bacterium]|nr:sugar phosphate isomerase/epimerase [Candidatus Aminicenantes bacterium]
MKRFKVGIDSYSLKPLRLSALEILDWAAANGADGVQFSERPLPAGRDERDHAFLSELGARARAAGLYLEWGGAEHIPVDLESGRPKDITAVNRRAAEEARALGVRIIRSCSGGLMRWTDQGPSTEALLRAAADGLRAQVPMLKDLGVTLAIETHFEFTTFELARLLEASGADPGDGLGVCLDTMNLLTMLEDPLPAVRRVLPWIVSTHIKDGGLLLETNGLRSFPAEAGRGVIDLKGVCEALSGLGRDVTLSLEDHGGSFLIPVFDPAFLARFPDLDTAEFAGLLRIAAKTASRVANGATAIISREDWPSLCEDRVRRGLAAVRAVVEAGAGRTP